MKKLIMFLIIALIAGWTGTVLATPIENWNGTDYTDTLGDGSSFGYYTNSGDFLFIKTGNNEGPNNLPIVEAAIEEYYGYDPTTFILTVTTTTFTNYDVDGNVVSGASTSGTWEVTPTGNTIDFYAVKASNAYAIYSVFPAEDTGSWSTYDLWKDGYGGKGGLEISHFHGYNGAPIPEPATMLLLGTGLISLAGVVGRGKIKIKKK